MPDRYDPDRKGVRRKLERVPALEELAASVELPLTHLAIGFTLAHPAVSAAIIGPRTMEQLEGLVGAGDVALDDETLDRIDEIVPPGTNLEVADGGWMAPAIAQAWRRRRPLGSR